MTVKACLSVLVLFIAPGIHAMETAPAGLQCEYSSNPLAIDVGKPRLSWILRPRDPVRRGTRQTAYRVLVATNPRDSGQGLRRPVGQRQSGFPGKRRRRVCRQGPC